MSTALAAPEVSPWQDPDYARLFAALPGLCVVLTPDLSVVAASDAYLKAAHRQRDEMLGRAFPEIVARTPADVDPDPEELRASLQRVLAQRTADTMPLQKCVLRPLADGNMEKRCWNAFNLPVLKGRELLYIMHCMEDITELNNFKQQQQSGQPRHQGESRTTEIFALARELGETNQKLREEHHETWRLLSAIIDSAAEAIISTTVTGTISSWNRSAEELFGYRAEETIGQPISMLYPPELKEEAQQILQRVNLGERIMNREGVRLHKNGQKLHICTNISPLIDELGRVVGSSRVLQDVSARREAEKTREQLQQAQKMEAIGQLTGGIAHDFNNLLAIILGNLDLMSEQLGPDHPLNEFIQPGMKAAEHGADLTRHLLAFGRKQALQPRVISVNELIHGFMPLVRRTLGAQVTLSFAPESDLWNVNVDPSQLQSALLNLSVNARDAMPGGGKLIYETQNVILDEEYTAQYPDLAAGDYVLIAVSDTGTGMSADTIEKVFEPFFTTKEVGKGSGLGLSMVYGFVKQSHGHVRIYSELNQGTTMKIYLPRTEGKIQPENAVASGLAPPTNKVFTLLIVEDSKDVLKVTSSMVAKLGYHALQAQTPEAALEILAAHPEIDLMLTDVMLPGSLNGPALAQKALQIHPGLKVLFNSGYAEHAIIQSGLLKEGVHLISKPFRRQQLAEKLMELLYNDTPIPPAADFKQ